MEHDECRHKQELFNKLRSINTEKSASDEEENPFDGGLNDEFDMDYDNHVDAERTPTPVVQDDKVNGEDNYDYIQETEESNEIDIKKQSTKKRNIRNYKEFFDIRYIKALTAVFCRQHYRQDCDIRLLKKNVLEKSSRNYFHVRLRVFVIRRNVGDHKQIP